MSFPLRKISLKPSTLLTASVAPVCGPESWGHAGTLVFQAGAGSGECNMTTHVAEKEWGPEQKNNNPGQPCK